MRLSGGLSLLLLQMTLLPGSYGNPVPVSPEIRGDPGDDRCHVEGRSLPSDGKEKRQIYGRAFGVRTIHPDKSSYSLIGN